MTTGKSPLVLALAAILASALAVARGDISDYKITVPVICCDMERQGGREKIVSELKRLGASRVLLACDRYQCKPEKRSRVMSLLRENAAAFRHEGFEVGAWTWSFHCTDLSGFTPMKASDGWTSPCDPCPLDPAFRKMAAEYVADLARCGVDLILLDDDLGFIFKHDSEILCLCDRHMDRIRKRLGRDVSADELKAGVMSGGPNSLRNAWMSAKGESLREFAAALRAAVDTVDPKVRMGQCALHSMWDLDGVDAVTISRILAGGNKPFLRLIGAPYWATVPDKEARERLQHVIEYERMERSWCGEGLEIVAEGDPFPRPRWACPASYLELFDLAIRADGRFDGIMKYALDYHSLLTDEPGYVDRHVRDRDLFAAVSKAFTDKTAVGVRVVEPMRKIAGMTVPEDLTDNAEEIGDKPGCLWRLFRSHAARMMSDCGIPSTYEGEGVASVAFGPSAAALTREDLKRGVILDVWAARILADRGIDVGIRDFGKKLGVNRELFEGNDIVCHERFKARQLALDPKAEVDSCFLLDCDFLDRGTKHIPAAFYYTNAAGGRFFVFSFDGCFNGQGMNRSYPRQRQLRRAVERLSGRRLPAFVRGNPDLYVMVKKAPDGTMSVGLWNCFADEVIAPIVELDGTYDRIEFIGCSGHLDGAKVILDDLPAWKFAGFTVSRIDALNRRIEPAAGDATGRIQAAIDDCFRNGGGCVTITKGEYEVSSFRMRSNVTLHLESGARVLASRDPSAYDGLIVRDTVETFDGQQLDSADPLSRSSTNHWNNGIVRIYRAHDVAIIGEPGSEIDGRNCYDEKGEEGYRGPHGISVHFSSNVVCRGYTMRDTGNWSHRFCLSSDVRIEGVSIRGGHDGLDFHGCERVSVEGCDVRSGDDCVAGYDNVGLTIRNCRLNSACSIFRIGGRNIIVEGVTAEGPADFSHRYGLPKEILVEGSNPTDQGRRNTLSFFTFYGNKRVRGESENIVFRNCRVTGIDKFMHYNFSGNEQWQVGPGLRDVTFENVQAVGLVQPLTVYGSSDSKKPIRLTFRNCMFAFEKNVSAFIRGANIGMLDVNDLTVEGVDGPFLIKWGNGDPVFKSDGLNGTQHKVEPANEPFSCKPI